MGSGWGVYANFYNDMIKPYREHMIIHGKNNTTLERIDYNKDYSKENCKWATRSEQSKNRSNTIIVEIDGVTYTTLNEVSDVYGIDYKTLQQRHVAGLRGKDLVKKVKSFKKKDRGELELEIDGKTYEGFSDLHNDYSYLNKLTIVNRYDAGLRGVYLIKPREYYTTNEGRKIMEQARKETEERVSNNK